MLAFKLTDVLEFNSYYGRSSGDMPRTHNGTKNVFEGRRNNENEHFRSDYNGL